MIKENMKLFIKILLCGLIWSILSVLICLLIVNFTELKFNDVLFSEGIILTIIGIFSAIGGSPTGASIQGFGQVNAQYIASTNLESIKDKDSKNSDFIKTTISIGLSTLSLILGGFLSIILTFVI